MENIKKVFINTLKNDPDIQNNPKAIQELVCDISRKKLYRLKDGGSIQKRVAELFTIFQELLKENDFQKSITLQGVIEGLVSAVNFDEEARLYEKIYEKERLSREIKLQKEYIYQTISNTFDSIHETIISENEVAKTALNDAKLKGIEMLGILKETTEEAILTTIERGEDIEETIHLITKNIVYQAINEGEFAKKRFLEIAKSVLVVAIDISDSDQAYAEDILNGTVFGLRDGIVKAVDTFKQDLKYSPEIADILSEHDLKSAKDEIVNIEEDFIELLREYAHNESEKISSKIIDDMVKNRLDNTFAKLQRLSSEAREVINIKIEELKENAYRMEKELKAKASDKFETFKESVEEMERKASQRVETLKNSRKTKEMQAEAKNLGNRAWEVAKDFIKNAKESFNKE